METTKIIHYLLYKCVSLEARLEVLHSAFVNSSFDSGGQRKAFEKELESLEIKLRDKLLVDHPFVKDEFDGFLNDLLNPPG